MYAVLGFDFDGWLKKEMYETTYDQFTIKILRKKLNKNNAPISNQIIIKTTDILEYEAHRSAKMFLSEIAWYFDTPIHGIIHTGGTDQIKGCTIYAGHKGSALKSVNIDLYKQQNLTNDQIYALGLYKEGISNNSIFFSYLCLFNILEFFLTPKKRESFLTSYIEDIWRVQKNLMIEGERLNGASQIQEYLYKTGRCSVAHTSSEPRMDIHGFDSYRKISFCKSIIKDAVRHYLKHHAGIPSLSNITY